MSTHVLKSRLEIIEAREVLQNRGLSATESKLHFLARKLWFKRALPVMDETKSWDVLRTTQFIEQNVSKASMILDIGAFASEILSILHRLGYSNLVGVDLDPQITSMPYAHKIRYLIADFLQAPFGSGLFDVITSISVIEHGLHSAALLSEIARLLCPGGFFVASFDYCRRRSIPQGFLSSVWTGKYSLKRTRSLLSKRRASMDSCRMGESIFMPRTERSIAEEGSIHLLGWRFRRSPDPAFE